MQAAVDRESGIVRLRPILFRSVAAIRQIRSSIIRDVRLVSTAASGQVAALKKSVSGADKIALIHLRKPLAFPSDKKAI
jgi:hypothetical protein